VWRLLHYTVKWYVLWMAVLSAAICSYDDTIVQGASRTSVTFSSPAQGIHQMAHIIIIMTSQSVIINKQHAC